MRSTFKKVVAPLALVSFLAMAFFGFATMTYGPDGDMQSNCPFSVMGASLCPSNALPGAIHHLSAYQSFISVPVHFDLTTLLISLLLVISTLLAALFHPPAYKIPLFVPY